MRSERDPATITQGATRIISLYAIRYSGRSDSRSTARNLARGSTLPSSARRASSSPRTPANLKPCPERPAAKATCGCCGMTVQDEMAVGAHRVHADGVVRSDVRGSGQMLLDEAGHSTFVGGVELAVDGRRIGDHPAATVLRDFESLLVELRKAVEAAIGQVVQETGKAAVRPILVRLSSVPVERLAAKFERDCPGQPAAEPTTHPRR